MECPECSERTPDESRVCVRCGAEFGDIAAESESTLSPALLGLLATLAALVALGFYWYAEASGDFASSTLRAGDTQLDFVCVSADDDDSIAKLEQKGWIESSGGFVSNDEGGKRCFRKKR